MILKHIITSVLTLAGITFLVKRIMFSQNQSYLQ